MNVLRHMWVLVSLLLVGVGHGVRAATQAARQGGGSTAATGAQNVAAQEAAARGTVALKSSTPMQPVSNNGGKTGWGRQVGKIPGFAAGIIAGCCGLGLLYAILVWTLYILPIKIVPRDKDVAQASQGGALSRSSLSVTHQPGEDDPDGLGQTHEQAEAAEASPESTYLIQPEEDTVDPQKIVDDMEKVAAAIRKGATAFMVSELLWLTPFVVVTGALIWGGLQSWQTMLAFFLGSLTSVFAAYLGMLIAVHSNVRTCYQCWSSLHEGFNCALLSGSVMGFTLVCMGVGSFLVTWLILDAAMIRMTIAGQVNAPNKDLAHALCGFGLGASLVALFARVGGGIYTKAADVGADLSGKNEYGMDEDDPRNPACIADNVGDNVGDIAGMGADLFGSFAESSAAACYIWYKFTTNIETADTNSLLVGDVSASLYPLFISASGIIAGLVTMVANFAFFPRVSRFDQVESRLKYLLLICTLVEVGFVFAVGHVSLPQSFYIRNASSEPVLVSDLKISGCVVVGVLVGFLIGMVTEYYTSHSYRPVRDTASAYQQSASTGLILGTALGQKSTAMPVLLIAGSVVFALAMAGPFGIAMAGLGMLSTLTIALTIDAYGPIADNAGGIAEMSGLGPHVRARTDCLDAAGNTTAAIGKGFAVGSAALVAMALFFAFLLAAHEGETGDFRLEMLNPYVLLGLFCGSMLPFVFAALLMTSVAEAAQDMLKECYRQFPLIINEGREPDYEECVKISTRASLREMILPAVIVVFSPIVGGLLFGTNFTCGLLVGILLSGLLLAISMSNSGGAFDNAKKYIEAGGLGDGSRKGSAAHKNAVIGDTLGDPLKDTSGPALNIFLKLSAVTALTFAPFLKKFSHAGMPFWAPSPMNMTTAPGNAVAGGGR
ncbi:unnamed protein product [Amoebophrya sp. A25]|nr:unnamed protein product [Amoebophrya sp. A25]|eukprot:GSA25T00020009001.1